MKKIAKLVMVILCSMMLFACGKNSEEDNTHIIDGVTYVHYPEDSIITAGEYTYSYIWSEYENEYGEGYIISITYPDGEKVVNRYVGTYFTSDGHRLQGKEYAEPYDLARMIRPYLETQEKKPVQGSLIITGIVLVLIGVVMFGAPEIGFKARYWEVENAEQSEASKGVSAAFGIISIIVGVIIALIGIF